MNVREGATPERQCQYLNASQRLRLPDNLTNAGTVAPGNSIGPLRSTATSQTDRRCSRIRSSARRQLAVNGAVVNGTLSCLPGFTRKPSLAAR
ncbi:MAG: hypothetical protein ACLSAH_15430 [Bilophila wadsworthia]